MPTYYAIYKLVVDRYSTYHFYAR